MRRKRRDRSFYCQTPAPGRFCAGRNGENAPCLLQNRFQMITIVLSIYPPEKEGVFYLDKHENRRTTLNDLAPGQSGTILSVGSQSGAVKRRLVDMGLTPGTEVKVTKIAPLGDPIELRVRGYSLSLRKEDARNITVEVRV